MRVVSLVVCVTVYAGCGSAFAADCGKGILWPFVRNPGDCLTDVELKAGQTGVYTGPLNTNVDVGAIKPNAAPPSTVTTPNSGGMFGNLFGGGSTPAPAPAPAAAATATPAPIPAVTATPAATPTQTATVTPAATSTAAPARRGNAACNKGYLWPFVRDPGDCLTAAEKKTNPSGTYEEGAVSEVVAPNAGNPANPPTPIAASASAADTAGVRVETSAPAPAAASCQKGWFWPFVRDTGDCATDQEKKNTKEK